MAPGFRIKVPFPKEWKFTYQELVSKSHRNIANGFYYAFEINNMYYLRLIHNSNNPYRFVQVLSVWQNKLVNDDFAKIKVLDSLAGEYKVTTGGLNKKNMRIFWGIIVVPDKEKGFMRYDGAIVIHNNYAYITIRYSADAGSTDKERDQRLHDFNNMIENVSNF